MLASAWSTPAWQLSHAHEDIVHPFPIGPTRSTPGTSRQ
jgi:hypothetical protein